VVNCGPGKEASLDFTRSSSNQKLFTIENTAWQGEMRAAERTRSWESDEERRNGYENANCAK